jgi:hypothetical protein
LLKACPCLLVGIENLKAGVQQSLMGELEPCPAAERLQHPGRVAVHHFPNVPDRHPGNLTYVHRGESPSRHGNSAQHLAGAAPILARKSRSLQQQTQLVDRTFLDLSRLDGLRQPGRSHAAKRMICLDVLRQRGVRSAGQQHMPASTKTCWQQGSATRQAPRAEILVKPIDYQQKRPLGFRRPLACPLPHGRELG